MRRTGSESESPEGREPGCWTSLVTSACSDRRLQLVGQGGQNLVEFAVAQRLFLLSSPAPPQQPHLEVGEEELRDLWPLLEAWKTTTIVSGFGTQRFKQKTNGFDSPFSLVSALEQ